MTDTQYTREEFERDRHGETGDAIQENKRLRAQLDVLQRERDEFASKNAALLKAIQELEWVYERAEEEVSRYHAREETWNTDKYALKLILKTRDEELTALKVVTVQQGEEIAKLKAENERLCGELDAAEQHVKIAHEASEREHEKQVASALLVTTLQEALKKLRAEVAGAIGLAEYELRQALGHTNVNVLRLRVEEASAALAAVPPQEPQA